MKFVKAVKANASAMGPADVPQKTTAPVATNASAGLSPELETALNEAASNLQSVAASLATHLEGQITAPEFTGNDEVAASRLIDWTADIFAIAEDMKFYLNPPKDSE